MPSQQKTFLLDLPKLNPSDLQVCGQNNTSSSVHILLRLPHSKACLVLNKNYMWVGYLTGPDAETFKAENASFQSGKGWASYPAFGFEWRNGIWYEDRPPGAAPS